LEVVIEGTLIQKIARLYEKLATILIDEADGRTSLSQKDTTKT
jgi:hypothetical protein